MYGINHGKDREGWAVSGGALRPETTHRRPYHIPERYEGSKSPTYPRIKTRQILEKEVKHNG